MKQITDAIRIQLVNWPLRYVFPLVLLLVVGLINVAVFALNFDANDPLDERVTGGLLSVFFTAGTGFLASITQTFPFVVGFGVTRRAFYCAVVLLAVVESMAYGLLILLFGLVERATGGWGVQMQFFDLYFLRQANLLLQWVIYTMPFLALAALFVLVGVIYKRWAQAGLWTLLIASTVLFGGLAVLVTWYGWWPAVGAWLAGQPSMALFGGYPLVLAVAVLGAGWLTIRRATT
jgi:hypothetical protein